MSKRESIALSVVYIVAGIFTYAHVYQRADVSGANAFATEVELRFFPAFGAGVAWPLYWTTHLAFRWTKPEGRA